MTGHAYFEKLSKPPKEAPARKLDKIKQDRLAATKRLTSPFAGVKVLFLDGTEWGEDLPDVTEGVCLALVMRWLWYRLAGRTDASFRDSDLTDLGAMQEAYMKGVRADLESEQSLEGSRRAVETLAAACGLRLRDLKVNRVFPKLFSIVAERALAREVTSLVDSNQLGSAWMVSFATRKPDDAPGGQTVVRFPGHAIGVFVATDQVEGESPLVAFDPNAGLYRIKARPGADRKFFGELERIYGDQCNVQVFMSAQVELDPTKVIEGQVDFDIDDEQLEKMVRERGLRTDVQK